MAKRQLAYFDQALAAYKRGDYKAAYEGFAAIAEEGDPAAQCNLAGMYESGLGVQQSDQRALHWYNSRLASSCATVSVSNATISRP
jgi:hypothetical protein